MLEGNCDSQSCDVERIFIIRTKVTRPLYQSLRTPDVTQRLVMTERIQGHLSLRTPLHRQRNVKLDWQSFPWTPGNVDVIMSRPNTSIPRRAEITAERITETRYHLITRVRMLVTNYLNYLATSYINRSFSIELFRIRTQTIGTQLSF